MRTLCALTIASTVLAIASPAAADNEDRFSITPYIWLPTVDGDLRFNIPDGEGGGPDIALGPADLEGVFMLAGGARFGRVHAFGDFIYLDFEESARVDAVIGPGTIEIPVDAGSTLELSGVLLTLGAGYDVVRGDSFSAQPFVGVRYLGLETTANWFLEAPLNGFSQQGTVSRDADAVDGLVGVRGEARAGNWVIPYYLDVGAGTSEFTWQGLIGLSYRFDWGDLRLAYRYLSYEQDEDTLVQELTLDGPAVGASVRF